MFAWAARTVIQRPNIVSIGIRGIKDLRVAGIWMPWHKISGVSRFSLGKARMITIELDSEFKKQLPRSAKLMAFDLWLAKQIRKFASPESAARILAPRVMINPRYMNGTLEDVIAAIKRFAPNPDLTRDL
jgi:hypothetical protein